MQGDILFKNVAILYNKYKKMAADMVALDEREVF